MSKDKKSLMLKKKHQGALDYFQCGRLSEAAQLLEELLRHHGNAERWNDWASVQFARVFTSDAERGYRRAIELEPGAREAVSGLPGEHARKASELVAASERANPNAPGRNP
jgi:Tfp pilus assembly protein PilF